MYENEDLINKPIIKLGNDPRLLQQNYPVLFLAICHYNLSLSPLSFMDFYCLFERMVKQIEDRLNIDFKLMPFSDGTPEVEKIIEFCLEVEEDNKPLIDISELRTFLTLSDFKDVTDVIKAPKSGEKAPSEYFYNKKGEKASTENIVQEYLENQGYSVLYCENTFWRPISILAFAEEIYSFGWHGADGISCIYGRKNLSKFMPDFYTNKVNFMKKCNILEFIKNQISVFGFLDFNMFRCMGTDYIEYIDTKGDELLSKIPNDYFVKIVSNMVNYPQYYNSGLPDFCCWNDNEFMFVEAKRIKVKMRENQTQWGYFLRKNNIPYKVVRVEAE